MIVVTLIKVVKFTFTAKESSLVGYCVFLGGTYSTYLGDLAMDERIILKRNLGKLDWKAWTLNLCMIQVARCSEHCNESSSSVKYKEFIES